MTDHATERFAILEAKYLTCRALQHFQGIIATDKFGQPVEHRDNGSWVDHVQYDVALTMAPADGAWVRFAHTEC